MDPRPFLRWRSAPCARRRRTAAAHRVRIARCRTPHSCPQNVGWIPRESNTRRWRQPRWPRRARQKSAAARPITAASPRRSIGDILRRWTQHAVSTDEDERQPIICSHCGSGCEWNACSDTRYDRGDEFCQIGVELVIAAAERRGVLEHRGGGENRPDRFSPRVWRRGVFSRSTRRALADNASARRSISSSIACSRHTREQSRRLSGYSAPCCSRC